MNGFNNPAYLTALVISNIVAIILLINAIHWPKIARLLFFLLFSWACWTNWRISQQNPALYLEYADLTPSSLYKTFINGWFSRHIQVVVGFIATCQGVIAVSMLLKGRVFKTGASAAILFLLAIMPLGVGSGFPSTIILAIAMYALLKREANEYLWSYHKPIVI
jgi:hypothetical protein